MGDSNNSTASSSFLQALAWLLFAVGGLSFWVGERAISEFTKTDRVLAEMKGIGLAVVFVGLGAVAKSYGERLEEGAEGPSSIYEDNSGRNS